MKKDFAHFRVSQNKKNLSNTKLDDMEISCNNFFFISSNEYNLPSALSSSEN